MVRGRRSQAAWAVLALAFLPGVAGACGSVTCSQTAPVPQSSFVGVATAIRAGEADFRVVSMQPVAGAQSPDHAPTVGATVTVVYADDGQRFLHAGASYRVVVNFSDGHYTSDVHTAEDCGTASGTTHADGSQIDTARVSWLKVHRAVLALVLAPVLALLVLSAVVWWRRRPRTVRVDDRYL